MAKKLRKVEKNHEHTTWQPYGHVRMPSTLFYPRGGTSVLLVCMDCGWPETAVLDGAWDEEALAAYWKEWEGVKP